MTASDPTPPESPAPSRSPLNGRSRRVLDLCERLRFLDTATHANRRRLDEIADLIVQLPNVADVPARLSRELSVIVDDMGRIDLERRAVRRTLHGLAYVCETVPVRVLHPDDLATKGLPA